MQTIDYIPNDSNNTRKIKHPWYEVTLTTSIEDMLRPKVLETHIEYFIKDLRVEGFWVKRAYLKYNIVPHDLIQVAFECVKLRDTKLEFP